MTGTQGLSLARFPVRRIPAGAVAHRIYRAYGPDGSRRTPWFFSTSTAAASGRFDLSEPQGTCYFSDREYGAWLETFRGARVVLRTDVERRRLASATRVGEPLRLADLTAAAAVRFGISLDLSAGGDYRASQRWALDLARVGFAGVIGWIRHDSTATARNLALFGTAGPRRSVRGWRTHTQPLTEAARLRADLARFRVSVIDEPYDVTVEPIP